MDAVQETLKLYLTVMTDYFTGQEYNGETFNGDNTHFILPHLPFYL